MAREIVVTSVPRGVKLGRSGFQVVMRTAGTREDLTESLEALAVYRHLPPGSGQNPECLFHRVLKTAAGQFHVLGRVVDAGSDYSNRSNKLAHLVALDQQELAPLRQSSPAAVLQAIDGRLARAWPGGPEERQQPFAVGIVPNVVAGPCRGWQEAAGDAGWAGVLADRAAKNQATLVIAPDSSPAWCRRMLGLFAEALAFVPAAKRWDVSFDTTVISSAPVLWRGTYAGSPESMNRVPGLVVVDLSRQTQVPPELAGLPLVAAARAGRLVEPARQVVTGGGPPPVGGRTVAGGKAESGGGMFDGLEVDRGLPRVPGSTTSSSSHQGPSAESRRKSGIGIGLALGGIAAVVFLLLAVVGGIVGWQVVSGQKVARSQKLLSDWAAIADGQRPKGDEPKAEDWSLAYQLPPKPAEPKADSPSLDQERLKAVVPVLNQALLTPAITEPPDHQELLALVESAERLTGNTATVADLEKLGIPLRSLVGGPGERLPPFFQQHVVNDGFAGASALIQRVATGKGSLEDYAVLVQPGDPPGSGLDAQCLPWCNAVFARPETGSRPRLADVVAAAVALRAGKATAEQIELIGGVSFGGFFAGLGVPEEFQSFCVNKDNEPDKGFAAAAELIKRLREGQGTKEDWERVVTVKVSTEDVNRWNAGAKDKAKTGGLVVLSDFQPEQPKLRTQADTPPQDPWESLATAKIEPIPWSDQSAAVPLEGLPDLTALTAEAIKPLNPEVTAGHQPYQFELSANHPNYSWMKTDFQETLGTIELGSRVFKPGWATPEKFKELQTDLPLAPYVPLAFVRVHAGQPPKIGPETFAIYFEPPAIRWQGGESLWSLCEGKEGTLAPSDHARRVIDAARGWKLKTAFAEKKMGDFSMAIKPLSEDRFVVAVTKSFSDGNPDLTLTLLETMRVAFDKDRCTLKMDRDKWSERESRSKQLGIPNWNSGNEKKRLGLDGETVTNVTDADDLPWIVQRLLQEEPQLNETTVTDCKDYMRKWLKLDEKKGKDFPELPLVTGQSFKARLVEYCAEDATIKDVVRKDYEKDNGPEPEEPEEPKEDASEEQKKKYNKTRGDRNKWQDEFSQRLTATCSSPLGVSQLLDSAGSKISNQPDLYAALVVLRELDGMVLAKLERASLRALFENQSIHDLFSVSGEIPWKCKTDGFEKELPVTVTVGPGGEPAPAANPAEGDGDAE